MFRGVKCRQVVNNELILSFCVDSNYHSCGMLQFLPHTGIIISIKLVHPGHLIIIISGSQCHAMSSTYCATQIYGLIINDSPFGGK